MPGRLDTRRSGGDGGESNSPSRADPPKVPTSLADLLLSHIRHRSAGATDAPAHASLPDPMSLRPGALRHCHARSLPTGAREWRTTLCGFVRPPERSCTAAWQLFFRRLFYETVTGTSACHFRPIDPVETRHPRLDARFRAAGTLLLYTTVGAAGSAPAGLVHHRRESLSAHGADDNEQEHQHKHQDDSQLEDVSEKADEPVANPSLIISRVDPVVHGCALLPGHSVISSPPYQEGPSRAASQVPAGHTSLARSDASGRPWRSQCRSAIQEPSPPVMERRALPIAPLWFVVKGATQR